MQLFLTAKNIKVPEKLLEAKEVAKLLGISLRKLDAMAASGEAPKCVRFGRMRRWQPSIIDAWLREQYENKT